MVLLEAPQQVVFNHNPTLSEKYGSLQLALSREEYDAYRAMQLDPIADDLADRFWEVSNGHIGAIAVLYEFVHFYSTLRFRQRIDPTIQIDGGMSLTPAPFNLQLLRQVFGYSASRMTDAEKLILTPGPPNVREPNLFLQHLTHTSPFTKGIPDVKYDSLVTPYMMLLALRKELYYETHAIPEVVKQCVRLGYVMLDRVSYSGRLDIRVAKFASPLHRFVVAETHLERFLIREHVEETDIVSFVLNVLKGFEQQELLKFQVLHLLESHYQMEFYRVANCVYKGAVMLTPEFFVMGDRGRIDFYIAQKKWGIELLQEGIRRTEHVQAFNETAKYYHFLKEGYIEQYLLLDCRRTKPPYSKIPYLYHAVFEGDYESVSLYDDFGNCKLHLHPLTQHMQPPPLPNLDDAVLGVKARDFVQI
ncbi:hypothetical protein VKT23_010599 [Stygiomarasmius scandens]|uniref:Uncharacterized protein n=1 Tax=Marasmiellus scandens TaxID=2682957 RepID=A0ABR1JEU1_9AGAR